jgi:alkanesulfonate monooxygenase SsuD/methylene tetrahydromethanopterin reductase-like flavin-dependent oxidoreductase (luciferase family)
MPTDSNVIFDFGANAGAELTLTDQELYSHVFALAKLGYELGFNAVWSVEHHFTDYWPTPSPLMTLGHIAARCPGLGLGTMVLVTPWHNPLRMAEEIAMLSNMTDGALHLGIGRGTAPLEYEAYNVPMVEAQDRFIEIDQLVRLALSQRRFSFEGQFYHVPREVELRPRPRREQIHFYAATVNPTSAERNATMGLPLLCTASPPDILRGVLDQWRKATAANGGNANAVHAVSAIAVLADTDAEARRLAKDYLPSWFRLQYEHYEVAKELHQTIKTYEPFQKLMGHFLILSDPDKNVDAWNTYMETALVGAPETVSRRVSQYRAIGFERILIQPGAPGVPRALQEQTLRRFAREVAPAFSKGGQFCRR